MRVEEVPVPPTARKDTIEGSYEINLRAASSEALRELKEKYGKAEVQIYFLAPEADWKSLNGFYEAQLAPRGLKRDASFATDHTGYKLTVWSGGGWWQREAVAVALIEAGSSLPDGGPQKFLAVFLAGE